MIFEIFYITTSKSNITYFKPCIQELQKKYVCLLHFCTYCNCKIYLFINHRRSSTGWQLLLTLGHLFFQGDCKHFEAAQETFEKPRSSNYVVSTRRCVLQDCCMNLPWPANPSSWPSHQLLGSQKNLASGWISSLHCQRTRKTKQAGLETVCRHCAQEFSFK